MEKESNVKEYNKEKMYLDDFLTLVKDAETNLEPYYSALEDAIKTYKADYVKPKNRSQVVVRHAKQMADNFIAYLVSDFVSEEEPAHFYPRNTDSDGKARLMGKYINYIWSRQFNRYEFTEEVVRSLVLEGMVCVKTGWKYDFDISEKRIDIPQEQYPEFLQDMTARGLVVEGGTLNEETGMIENILITKTIILEDRPDATVLDIRDIFFDITAKRTSDIRWWAEKMRMTLSDVRKQDIKYNKKSQMQLENVDKWIEKLYFSKLENDRDFTSTADWDTEDKYYLIDDYANKHAREEFDVYRWVGEYDLDGDGITEMVEAIFTRDYLLAIRPYEKIKGVKFPYILGYYIKHNREKGGEGMMTTVGDMPKIVITLWRSLIDYVSRVNLGEKIVNRQQVTDPFEMKKLQENLPGTIYTVDGDARSAITPIQPNPFPFGVQQILQLADIEEQRASRVQENAAGVFNSPTSAKTATAAAIAAQGLNNFRMFIFGKAKDTIFRTVFSHWLAYINHYIDPEQDIIFNDVIGEGELMEVKGADLLGYYDVDVQFHTQAMADLKIHQMNIMFQNIGPAIQAGAITQKELRLLFRRWFTLMGDKSLAQVVSRRDKEMETDDFKNAVQQEASKMVEQLQNSSEFMDMVYQKARDMADFMSEVKAQQKVKTALNAFGVNETEEETYV